MAPEPRQCPQCGAEIPERFPEALCPKCLLGESIDIVRSAPRPRLKSGRSSSSGDRNSEATTGIHSSDRAPRVELLRPMFPDIEIIDLLGAGGMGAVYKARQPRLDRLVALKVLSCPKLQKANFALRFEREAQVMAKLNHPNIATIHDFGEISSEVTGDEPLFYFLMEFVDGPDLSQLIRARSLDVERSLSLMPEICDALQYAHDEGVSHRDIKPGNILIDQKGMVKIVDFGLATLLGDQNERFTSSLTMTGTSMGTPIYTAPEIWETPEKVDHRADIYSLGIVFYEMLTSERPAGVFDPPSKSAPVDPRIDRVILKALNKRPERRFQSTRDFKTALLRITNPNQGLLSRRSVLIMAGAAVIGFSIVGSQWVEKLAKTPGNEPKLTEPPVNSEAILKPIPVETIPGRLRAVGMWQPPGQNEELRPFDLSAAEPYRDFVQVVVNADSGVFFALRANGDVISNLEGFQSPTGIHRFGQHSGKQENLVAIDRNGQAKFLIPQASGRSDELPKVDRPVIDVVLSEGTGLLLLDDGRAIPFGRVYDDSSWKLPPKSDLTGVKDIAVGIRSAAVLKPNGAVVAWNSKGKFAVPSELSAGIREITISFWSSVFALDTGGSVWVSKSDGTLNSAIHREGVARLATGDFRSSPFYQTANGSWHLLDYGLEKLHPDLTAALPLLKGLPPEAFYFCSSGGPKREAYLLWIEPQ